MYVELLFVNSSHFFSMKIVTVAAVLSFINFYFDNSIIVSLPPLPSITVPFTFRCGVDNTYRLVLSPWYFVERSG